MKEALMKTARWRDWSSLAAFALLLICWAPATAQGPNLALHKPLFDQSSEWNGTDQYNGSHVTDGIVCEINQQEGGSGISSYWLGAEGQVNQTVTIDLGAPTLISEIHLRNTHNAQYNDRNTMDFMIQGATDVQSCSIGTKTISDIVNPVIILMGTLSDVDGITCPDEIPVDIFDTKSGLTTGGVAFRYVKFTAINSYHDPSVDNKNKNVGLNELEVYGSQ
jgi:hypothetical protein